MISLDTDRLTLRTCVLDDFEDYAAMWAEAEVELPHVPGTKVLQYALFRDDQRVVN
jgi:hypothetical protein